MNLYQAMNENGGEENMTGQSFSVSANYTMLNEIISTDDSITVANNGLDGSPVVDLSIELECDASVGAVLEFVSPSSPGVHSLKMAEGARGIIRAGKGGLSYLPPPGGAALLVCDGGEIGWLSAADGDAAFGVEDGEWTWYPLGDCEGAGSGE